MTSIHFNSQILSNNFYNSPWHREFHLQYIVLHVNSSSGRLAPERGVPNGPFCPLFNFNELKAWSQAPNGMTLLENSKTGRQKSCGFPSNLRWNRRCLIWKYWEERHYLTASCKMAIWTTEPRHGSEQKASKGKGGKTGWNWSLRP